MITTTFTSDPSDIELLEAAALTKAEFAGVSKRKHTKVLRRLIDEADLVLGVFVEDGSLRTWIIKGELQLELIRHTKVSMEMATRVIHVRQAEEAEAMRRTIGDGARLQ